MLKKPVSRVLAPLRPSTYQAYWRQSTYPLACDRSERFEQSLVCTSCGPSLAAALLAWIFEHPVEVGQGD